MMWNAYGHQGVAVRTDIEKLETALVGQADIALVSYIDFSHPDEYSPTIDDYLYKKRREFGAEREVRAVLSSPMTGADLARPPAVRKIDVDIASLVTEVVVSPFSPPWHRAMIQGLLKRLRAEVPVRQSALSAPPTY
ncbi:DUF2971 domain-containing protein [Plantibacter sp. VKM Ac-2876]|uniref:DUF2971 domain-containing protein n=1 Tax=Plantibacter sp. VKM Ac-2876 TaxID=2783826 RepID=UPI001E4CC236|nr:hypothetical protein [Plantibacter sp. VKM Ac-2876]